MSAGYMVGSVTFAFLCSSIWLLMGNTLLSGALVYLVSGQVAMLAMIAQSTLRVTPKD